MIRIKEVFGLRPSSIPRAILGQQKIAKCNKVLQHNTAPLQPNIKPVILINYNIIAVS